MDEETIAASEVSTAPAAGTDSKPVDSVPDQIADGALTLEELADAEETVPMTTEPVITIEEIQTIGSDLMHVDLFGSFLICGTLIGLFLFRGIHGT